MDGIGPNGKPRLLKRSLPGPLAEVSNEKLYNAVVDLFQLLDRPLTGIFLYRDKETDDI